MKAAAVKSLRRLIGFRFRAAYTAGRPVCQGSGAGTPSHLLSVLTTWVSHHIPYSPCGELQQAWRAALRLISGHHSLTRQQGLERLPPSFRTQRLSLR